MLSLFLKSFHFLAYVSPYIKSSFMSYFCIFLGCKGSEFHVSLSLLLFLFQGPLSILFLLTVCMLPTGVIKCYVIDILISVSIIQDYS